MPYASIIVPAYNVAKTITETLEALQYQSFTDFEVLVVNDGSTDHTPMMVAPFLKDPRFRLVRQPNRGLAGARNGGINEAQGAIVGFCDADDLWHPEKLDRHVAHLQARPDVGLSFSGSALIDEDSRDMGLRQRPRLRNIQAAHVFKRNPVGNGSAAMLRREALDTLAYNPENHNRLWYFDETFRQSEDIECWLRLCLSSDWQIEGVPGALTYYRVAREGLSANTERQLASWERMVAKLRPLNPAFFARHEDTARAYQLRYLARRAVSAGDGAAARHYALRALKSSARPLLEEPFKSAATLAASALTGRGGFDPLRYATQLRK